MHKLIKTICTWNFCLFIVTLFDSQLFGFIQTIISECDPDIFKNTGMIVTFLIINSHFIKK